VSMFAFRCAITPSVRLTTRVCIKSRAWRLLSTDSISTQAHASHSVPGVVSGAPETFLTRKVRIFKPTRTAVQQGPDPEKWRLDFDRGQHWVNPLMGWTSSSDSSSQLTGGLTFTTKDDAIAYAKRQGYDFEVEPEHKSTKRAKSYSDNFKFKGTPVPKA